MITWYKKAQEDEDLLADSFNEFVADDKNKLKQGDLKNWPDGQSLIVTVKDAIVERANNTLSKLGLVISQSQQDDLLDCVTDAAPWVKISKEEYLKRMTALLLVSVVFCQSLDSVEMSLTSNKELMIYAILIESGKVTNKEELRQARDAYIEKFKDNPLPAEGLASILSTYYVTKKASSRLLTKVASGHPRFSYSPDSPKLIKGVSVDCQAIDTKGGRHGVRLYISDSGTADLIIGESPAWPYVRLTKEFAEEVINPTEYKTLNTKTILDCKKLIVNFKEVIEKAMEAYQYFDNEVTRVYEEEVAEAMATKLMEESSSRIKIRISESESEPDDGEI